MTIAGITEPAPRARVDLVRAALGKVPAVREVRAFRVFQPEVAPMSRLVVQKYGGSVLRDEDSVRRVARVVGRTAAAGDPVVVVVSALASVTDRQLERAARLLGRVLDERRGRSAGRNRRDRERLAPRARARRARSPRRAAQPVADGPSHGRRRRRRAHRPHQPASALEPDRGRARPRGPRLRRALG